MISTILLVAAFTIVIMWLFWDEYPFFAVWIFFSIPLLNHYKTGVDSLYELFSMIVFSIIWSYWAAEKSFENEMKQVDNQ